MNLTPLGQAGAWISSAAVLKPFLEKIFGPLASEIGGLISDPVAEWRKQLADRRGQRFVRVASGAAEQHERAGVEAIAIPDYIAVPLIEAATLVDDDSLLEKWASLLANASNPATAPSVSHLFPVMLSNLSPREAKFLDVFFDYGVKRISIRIQPLQPSQISLQSRANEFHLLNAVTNSDFKWRSNEEKTATLDNLVSLGIMRRDTATAEGSYKAFAAKLLKAVEMPLPPRFPLDVMVQTEDFYQLTVAGAAFVMACRPADKQP